jgi:phosphate transport system protein
MHFLKEIDGLKNAILALSALVEENLHRAVQAVSDRDAELAQVVINKDLGIDEREVDVEEECLKILALHQPVAIDLRFIISVLKINNDLERIGDLTVNIAERALYLSTTPPIDVPLRFPEMAEKAQGMLKKSLDALVNLDEQAAREVCASDDEVDAMNRDMYNLVKDAILGDPSRERVELLIHALSVSRHLERIADHTTNIAEDVIYMISGEIVRHHVETYDKSVREAQHDGDPSDDKPKDDPGR